MSDAINAECSTFVIAAFKFLKAESVLSYKIWLWYNNMMKRTKNIFFLLFFSLNNLFRIIEIDVITSGHEMVTRYSIVSSLNYKKMHIALKELYFLTKISKWKYGTWKQEKKMIQTVKRKVANRPSLEVQYGFFHSFLVVFSHVLVHVWVVGADIFFSAPVGHRSKLQRWVLLLWMLKLARAKTGWGREGGRGGMRHNGLPSNLSDLFLSTFQNSLNP